MQEGPIGSPPGIATESGLTIVTGESDTVGAPQLLLTHRLGSRIRKSKLHSHYVIVEIALLPPVLIFSLYLPPFSSHGVASFESTLDNFTRDLAHMHSACPGAFIAGGADVNTQLAPMDGKVGRYTGAVERLADRERADALCHLLATADLKAPTSFQDLGPTRHPWPGQTSQKPSVIDYILVSQRLHCEVVTDDLPTPHVTTDHSPVGATIWAPYASRRDRRRQFEHLLAHSANNPKRLPRQSD